MFNVAGNFCATQAKCPHKQGPLNEGKLDGSTVTCPWHGSQFNVCTGVILQGPAVTPLKMYSIVVEGEVGRVERCRTVLLCKTNACDADWLGRRRLHEQLRTLFTTRRWEQR